MADLLIKFIKLVGKIIYGLVFFIFIIYGGIGVSKVLNYFNITGTANTTLTCFLCIYTFGMFVSDIDKAYKKDKQNTKEY